MFVTLHGSMNKEKFIYTPTLQLAIINKFSKLFIVYKTMFTTLVYILLVTYIVQTY